MKILQGIIAQRDKILINQSPRSKKIIISASSSLIIKALSILTSFMLISLSISCIDVEHYGVWLTISSVITWISVFDIGLVTSLRNKITEAIAIKDWQAAKKYTSTTYALLFIIIVPVWIAFLLGYPYLNWKSIFNTSISSEELKSVILCVFTSFCLQFLLKPITSILTADQKHALANAVYLIINTLSIACLILFSHYFSGSLYLISLLFGLMPCLILVFYSIILYTNKYRFLSPSYSTIDFTCRKELLGLGFKFFIIQLAGLLIFSSNNFIISHLLGNEQVTYYNLVFKYFSVITIVYSLVNAPFWTAFTEAYTVKDWHWIKKVTKQANQLCIILLFLTLIMLLLSSWIYKIWIDQSVQIPFILSALMALNVGLTLYGSTYTSFINGTGKIRLQAYLSIVVLLFHIPMCYFLIKVAGLGLNGLMVLTIIWSIISLILWYIQYKRILIRSKEYIWN